jgi:hypothetical protein
VGEPRSLPIYQLLSDMPDPDEPAWMLEYSKKEKIRQLSQKRRELEARLQRVRADEERRRKAAERTVKRVVSDNR